jgi:hypothetical protein
MKLYCICIASDGSEDACCNMRTLKMIQGLGGGGSQLLEIWKLLQKIVQWWPGNIRWFYNWWRINSTLTGAQIIRLCMGMLGKRNICMLFAAHSHIDEQKEHRVRVCEKFVVVCWRSATHLIHLTLNLPTFLLLLKWKLPLKWDFRILRMSRTYPSKEVCSSVVELAHI